MAIRPESGTTLRRDLTVVANEYAAELARMYGFIGLKVAGLFEVGEEASKYPVWSRENFLKTTDTKRAADGKYNFIDGEFGSQSYSCEEHGLSSLLDDKRKARYKTWLNFESAMTKILIHRVLLAQEQRIAALVFDTGVYSAVAAAVNWATLATATPIDDIETGLRKIQLNTGFPPQMVSLILTAADFFNLTRCTQIVDQVKYTFSADQGVRPAQLKPAHIKAVLDIKEVLVAAGGYDTKEEGVTSSVSSVWSSGHAQLAVLAAENAPLETPSAWRTLLWTEDSPVNPVVERYYSDDRRGQVVRVRNNVDEVGTSEADLLNYLIDLTP